MLRRDDSDPEQMINARAMRGWVRWTGVMRGWVRRTGAMRGWVRWTGVRGKGVVVRGELN